MSKDKIKLVVEKIIAEKLNGRFARFVALVGAYHYWSNYT